MSRKKQRRDHAKRFTAEGLPRDGRDWTEADWASLFHHVEAAKREIAKRHNEPPAAS